MSAIFSLTPVSQQLSLAPGETFEGSLEITNPNYSDSNIIYEASVLPFTVADETYKADLLTETRRTEIKNWISLPNPSGVLEPNRTAFVPFSISVPDSAPSGGQYAVLVVSSHPADIPDSDLRIGSIYELTSLIYAEISGTTIHDASIESLHIGKFFVGAPSVSAIVANSGNIHEYTEVSIVVTDVFTNEELYSTEENNHGPFSEIDFPESTRLISRELNNLPSLGLFRIEEKVSIGGITNKIEETALVSPLWFLLVTVLAVFSLFFAILVSMFKKKRKTRGILKVK